MKPITVPPDGRIYLVPADQPQQRRTKEHPVITLSLIVAAIVVAAALSEAWNRLAAAVSSRADASLATPASR